MVTNNRMAPLEQLSKYVVERDKDFLKEALTLLINALMDAEVTSIIGTEKYERNGNRNNYRNGYGQREWDTRVGALQLSIPNLRHESYFSSLLEPRKMSEKLCKMLSKRLTFME
ncbi:Transposase, Mutator family [Lutispora thermophila DSM 19022]|jgi:putative transposase|uniref:Mutator family transposase n=1 Tax=Lutispora thermophila DSM 19022 TaxID=1122184 RepID=A0A1M6B0N7_9FIRM|nr:Transposase, Mutator family [Lutispora thermophila DSM 19022]